MKKLFALLLALLMVLSMTACGSDEYEYDESEPDVSVSEPDEPAEPAVPFSGGTITKEVGGLNLTAEFLPMAEPMVTDDMFKQDVTAIGDKVYLLSDEKFYEYTLSGNTLTFSREITLDDEYEYIDRIGDKVMLSQFMSDTLVYDGDAVIASYADLDKVSAAPDGTWGISWFTSAEDCEKVTFADGVATKSPMAFAGVDMAHKICVDEQYIYVCGSHVDGSGEYVFVYDHSGVLKMTLDGDPSKSYGLGSITQVIGTENGFLGLDGNMRDIIVWSTDGTWQGSVQADVLFGTDYPWLCAADRLEDGSILAVLTQKMSDGATNEVIMFKVTGF